MIVGHLPAGYLLAKAAKTNGLVFWGIVVGSILPDLDMLWFLFVDHGTVHHHEYWTHRPIVWLVVLLAGWYVNRPLIWGIGIGALLHMMLDSIAGRIDWGWPLVNWPMTLVEVPATQSHWVWSFVLHWTFGVELMIVAAAILVFWRTRR